MLIMTYIIFQPMFLDLAFGAALAVFLLLEIIRVSPDESNSFISQFLGFYSSYQCYVNYEESFIRVL